MAKRKRLVAKRITRKPGSKMFERRGLMRQLLIIFLLSFFISTALILYLFGMTPDFFARLIRCLLVVFLLFATVVAGIIPVINYYGNKFLR